jgi:Uma2 family endonuclease
MSTGTLVSEQEYLSTSYSPDREYRDGVLVERNVPDNAHSFLQAMLAWYFNDRRKQWDIQAYTEFRIRVRDKWYPVPDVCVYKLPRPKERYPSRLPLLWIEILSEDDKIIEVWNRAAELVKQGVPYVCVIDPNTLESQLHTSAGIIPVTDKTLRLPDSPIVVPLLDVIEE